MTLNAWRCLDNIIITFHRRTTKLNIIFIPLHCRSFRASFFSNWPRKHPFFNFLHKQSVVCFCDSFLCVSLSFTWHIEYASQRGGGTQDTLSSRNTHIGEIISFLFGLRCRFIEGRFDWVFILHVMNKHINFAWNMMHIRYCLWNDDKINSEPLKRSDEVKSFPFRRRVG